MKELFFREQLRKPSKLIKQTKQIKLIPVMHPRIRTITNFIDNLSPIGRMVLVL